MKNGRKIFWGVLFILGAVALLVGKLGYLGDFGFWSILLTIGLIGILIQGIFDRSFGTILFALAFLAIVNDKLLGIEAITPWPVLGAALLGTIGLDMIFPKHKWKNHIGIRKEEIGEVIEEGTDGDLRFVVSFGESVKYVNSKEVSYVRGECSFGNLEIYFNNAELKNKQATVKVDCSFGSTVLHVPADWKVVLNVETSFGGADEHGHCNPSGENVLYVTGDVSFGNLEIRYF